MSVPVAAHGFVEMELNSWRDFAPWISDALLQYGGQAIWRGQSNAEWALEASFDRAVRTAKLEPTDELAQLHLERFKRATRGRRTFATRSGLTDDEWWTLGQHYGLVTPMLDWTYSPYVALYFAFLEVAVADETAQRAVWILHTGRLEELNARAAAKASPINRPAAFRILDPLVDENARLVNQNGVFTRGPAGITLDAWIRETAAEREQVTLVKVVVPGGDRENCLRHLNQMNINHVTLFPDLEGASRQCNHQLTISGY